MMEVTDGQFLQIRYNFVEPSLRVMSCASSKKALTSRVLSSRQVAVDPETDVTAMSSKIPLSSMESAALRRLAPDPLESAQNLYKTLLHVRFFDFTAGTSSSLLMSNIVEVPI